MAQNKKTNVGLSKYALGHLGTKYVMGTNCRVLTRSTYTWLLTGCKSWFNSEKRKKVVEGWIGSVTTDCHGLIEGYLNDDNENGVVERNEGSYDTYADNAYNIARRKGLIDTIPEEVGLCVRFKGHVGIYIGNGYVVEARGFDYGTVVTKLKKRPWTHWFEHSKIERVRLTMDIPAEPITPQSTKYDIAWLQLNLNRQIEKGVIKTSELAVDGSYGNKTAKAVKEWQKYKGWSVGTGFYVGVTTIKSISK